MWPLGFPDGGCDMVVAEVNVVGRGIMTANIVRGDA